MPEKQYFSVIVYFKNFPKQQDKNKHNNDNFKFDILLSDISEKTSPDVLPKARKCINEYILKCQEIDF